MEKTVLLTYFHCVNEELLVWNIFGSYDSKTNEPMNFSENKVHYNEVHLFRIDLNHL